MAKNEGPVGGEIEKGADAMTVNQGLIMLGERKIEEIQVELSLGPICSFQNQAMWAFEYSEYWGPHRASYARRQAGILSNLGKALYGYRARFVWVVVLLLFPICPDAGGFSGLLPNSPLYLNERAFESGPGYVKGNTITKRALGGMLRYQNAIATDPVAIS